MIEIVDLYTQNGDFPVRKLLVYQRVIFSYWGLVYGFHMVRYDIYVKYMVRYG
jgi:hypothetical protein